MKAKKVLFLDRDGTLILEPEDEQVDCISKLTFYPGALRWLPAISEQLDYELVLVSNQDGLGTDSFPFSSFIPVHEKMLEAFRNEGVEFRREHIDPSFPEQSSPNRKPEIGMLKEYLSDAYDLKNSIVIGDRVTDVQLAENLGAKAIYMNDEEKLESESLALQTTSWKQVWSFLSSLDRTIEVKRETKETCVNISVNIDGDGLSNINTGLKFFDHMLEQIAKHGQIGLKIAITGDLEVDEHHTIEDVAIVLGEAINSAMGKKIGIERYGFSLPMDEAKSTVLLDMGGRSELVWKVDFKREFIGDMPTEMMKHFFKSLSDSMKCNLNIEAEGENEHHKIEAVFKAFGRALKMAKVISSNEVISTKGVLE